MPCCPPNREPPKRSYYQARFQGPGQPQVLDRGFEPLILRSKRRVISISPIEHDPAGRQPGSPFDLTNAVQTNAITRQVENVGIAPTHQSVQETTGPMPVFPMAVRAGFEPATSTLTE